MGVLLNCMEKKFDLRLSYEHLRVAGESGAVVGFGRDDLSGLDAELRERIIKAREERAAKLEEGLKRREVSVVRT